MPRFAFSARDPAGRIASDEISAPTRKDALRLLASRGLQPLKLDELAASGRPSAPAAAAVVKAGSARTPAGSPGRKFSRSNFLPFLQALSELTGSGLSAGEAVRLLALRLRDRDLRGLSAAVWDSLSEGLTLSQAMEQLPHVFDRQTISLVRAGEATGSLNEVLHRLITHNIEQREMRQKLITALIYPVFVCIVAFGVILFFVLFLMPRLQSLLTSLGSKLPVATQLLVTFAQLLLHYGIVLLPLAVFGAMLFWRWRNTEKGRTTTDAWLVRIPGVRRLAIDTAVLNFMQTFAVLLENGINPAEALRPHRAHGRQPHRAGRTPRRHGPGAGRRKSLRLLRTHRLPARPDDRPPRRRRKHRQAGPVSAGHLPQLRRRPLPPAARPDHHHLQRGAAVRLRVRRFHRLRHRLRVLQVSSSFTLQ